MAMVEERSNKGARVEKVVKTWQRFGRYGRRHSRRRRTDVVVETAVRGAYHMVAAQALGRRGAPTMMEPTRYTCKRLEGGAGLSAQSAAVFRTSRTSRTERLGLDSHELASALVLGLNPRRSLKSTFRRSLPGTRKSRSSMPMHWAHVLDVYNSH